MSNRKVKEAKNFVLKFGRSIKGVSAQTIGNELTGLCDKTGKLVAGTVVEAARPEDAALHPVFEWDDAVAGELWRHHEARHLIKSVRFVRNDEETQEKTVTPVFYFVPPAGGNGPGAYHKTEVIVEHPDMLARTLDQLREQLASAEKSIQSLLSFAEQQTDEEWKGKLNLAALAFAAARDAIAALH